MKENSATIHGVTTLDKVDWIFNIKGNDVSYTTGVLAYVAINIDNAYLLMI